jgi:hypothetical protein
MVPRWLTGGDRSAPAESFPTRRTQIVGCGLYALLDFVTRWSVYKNFGVAVGLTLILTPLVLVMAAGLALLYRRLGFEGRLTPGAILWIFGLSIAAALALVGLSFMVRVPGNHPMPDRTVSEQVMVAGFYYFMIFLSWSLVCFWLTAENARRTEERRASRAEAEALRVELQRLRLQLNPHFLINALTGVAEEIERDPALARPVLLDLTLFLRHALDGVDRLVMSVAEEVEGVEAYLSVQALRFGPALVTTVDVDAQAFSRSIAGFLLQPLVENAIEHGLAAPMAEVDVQIRAEGARLNILVRNRGHLTSTPPPGHAGIGLGNVRRRLALHYPGRHRFDLVEEDGHVLARLLLEGEPCSGS